MGDTSPHTVAELEAQDRFHGIRDTGQALTTALTIPGAGENCDDDALRGPQSHTVFDVRPFL